jgi:hypothetical protein
VTSFTAPTLAEGKYYWRVRGINQFGAAGDWSTTRNFVVDTNSPLSPVLDSPADLGSSRGTPLFSWNASAGAKYYQFRTTTT